MNNHYGENFCLSVFGASHAEKIGVRIQGLPVGFRIDKEALRLFMKRRAPGQGLWSTPRKEADEVIFEQGVADEGTIVSGTLVAVIYNKNVRRSDYDKIRDIPRPGHADYTARVRFGSEFDMSGGGPFSGRMTAPICIAGGIALQILSKIGITVNASIASVGGESDPNEFDRIITAASEAKDSVGGVIECVAEGVPAGIGDPMFSGVENKIAQIVFGIPAVKGIEFGSGFEASSMRGSENNDAFYYDGDGTVRTRTNHAGGILGGLTDGMPVTFRAAVKPTPSIAAKQESINLRTGEPTVIEIEGRHDPCIVPRAVPVIEAACACALLDLIITDRRNAKRKEVEQ